MSQVSALSKKSGSDPFGLSPNDLSRIKILLNQESGIQIADDHFAMVHCRLVKILRDSGLPDFKSLIDKAEVPDGNELREKITSALTTNVTQFFREKHHFEHLTKNVLNRGEGGYGLHGLRIWSAGCSNGSEPYTAAITVMTHLKATEAAKARILGTDIDPNMIEAGRKGIYPAKELEPLTREAMADYLGLTLETVSRQISALKRDDVIRLEGKRHVTVPDFDRLLEEAGDDSDGGMLA